jgi:hypothetical protein
MYQFVLQFVASHNLSYLSFHFVSWQEKSQENSDHVGPERRFDDIIMWVPFVLMLPRKFRQGCMIFGNATLGSDLSEGTWRSLIWSGWVKFVSRSTVVKK